MGDATVDPSVCFKVQKIIGVSIGEGNLRNYQVQWAPSWVSGFHLVGCEKLIQDFIREQSEDVQRESGEDQPNCSGLHIDLNDSTGFDTGTMSAKEVDMVEGVEQLSSRMQIDILDSANLEKQNIKYDDSNDMVSDVQVIPPLLEDGAGAKDEVNPNFEWIENSYDDCQEKDAAGNGLESVSSSTEEFPGIDRVPSTVAPQLASNTGDELIRDNPDVTNESENRLNASLYTAESESEEVSGGSLRGSASSYSMKHELGDEDVDDIVLVEPSETDETYSKDPVDSPLDSQNTITDDIIALTASNQTLLSETEMDNQYPLNNNNNVVLTFSFPPREFKCTTCHVVFTTRAMLTQHCNVFHSNTGGGEGGGEGGGRVVGMGGGTAGMGGGIGSVVYPCPICSENFESKSSLRKHKLTHKPELKCCICDEVFLENRYLMAHMRTHQKGALRCRYCDKVCVSKSILDRHERVHTGERPFRCELCPKAYKRKEDLLLHSKNHRPPGLMYSHM